MTKSSCSKASLHRRQIPLSRSLSAFCRRGLVQQSIEPAERYGEAFHSPTSPPGDHLILSANRRFRLSPHDADTTAGVHGTLLTATDARGEER